MNRDLGRQFIGQVVQLPPAANRHQDAGCTLLDGNLNDGNGIEYCLVWNHPLSFVAFLGLGGLLLAAGIVLYLWSLVSAPS